jgi:hypothetical protein
MWLEGLGKLKKKIHIIGIRNPRPSGLYSIVSQRTALQRAAM